MTQLTTSVQARVVMVHASTIPGAYASAASSRCLRRGTRGLDAMFAHRGQSLGIAKNASSAPREVGPLCPKEGVRAIPGRNPLDGDTYDSGFVESDQRSGLLPSIHTSSIARSGQTS